MSLQLSQNFNVNIVSRRISTNVVINGNDGSTGSTGPTGRPYRYIQ